MDPRRKAVSGDRLSYENRALLQETKILTKQTS